VRSGRPDARWFQAVFGLSLVAAFSAVACGGDEGSNANGPTPPPTEDDPGVGGPSVTPGNDADAAPFVPPPACVGTKLPTEEPCTVAEGYGVFVAPKGDDAAEGSRVAPVKTIQRGIQLAKEQKKRVYVCAGKYAESLVLADGVSIFGYFNCEQNWALSDARAVVESPTSPAARARGITTDTRVEGLELIAPNFGQLPPAKEAAAQSSIGLVAFDSPRLLFVNGRIRAGSGQNGADGESAVQLAQRANANGGAPDSRTSECPHKNWGDYWYYDCVGPVVGPRGGESRCEYPDGSVAPTALNGGNGGSGGNYSRYRSGEACNTIPGVGNGAPIRTCIPIWEVAPQGQGAAPGDAGPGGSQNPAPGRDGANGRPFGRVTEAGYEASDGEAGANGEPGAGRGGSAGLVPDRTPNKSDPSHWRGPTGAGGGAGGCAGLAGTPGRGGGGSIAVLTLDSPLTLRNVALETSDAGKAGRGSVGSSGTPGGIGGLPSLNGVSGSNGGVSGSGGAGPSVGVVVKGAKPTSENVTFQGGKGGAGAPAVTRDGRTLPATSPGTAAQEHVVL
jgi:hypothetical protein